MNQRVDILALAKLARLQVGEAERTKLESEIPVILALVEEIQKASASVEHKGQGLHNVLRDDTNPHESGLHTETLLSAAPAREGEKIAVTQVVSRK